MINSSKTKKKIEHHISIIIPIEHCMCWIYLYDMYRFAKYNIKLRFFTLSCAHHIRYVRIKYIYSFFVVRSFGSFERECLHADIMMDRNFDK